MDSVSISEVSPTRLYAARCMLSLKHSLLQGRKKSKDEDYSPHTTKKKSLKRTQPTRLSFPPLPEAPRSITIDMEMEMERKNPLSSHSDADDSSSIGAVSYDEVIRWVVIIGISMIVFVRILAVVLLAISFLFKPSQRFILYLSYVLVISAQYSNCYSFICRSFRHQELFQL